MAGDDEERVITAHYNITTLFPSRWPADEDGSDDDSGDDLPSNNNKTPTSPHPHRSKPSHSALDRLGTSRRHTRASAQRHDDGPESLARKDEPDPLGFSDSVVRLLRQRGLPVDEDARLRK